MHKQSDINWVIGNAKGVICHPSGGLSSADGLRQLGNVDSPGVMYDSRPFRPTGVKPKPLSVDWVDDELFVAGVKIQPVRFETTPSQEAQFQDRREDWAKERLRVVIPPEWKAVHLAAAEYIQPEVAYWWAHGLKFVWAAVESDKIVFTFALTGLLMAWGGDHRSWDSNRRLAIRPDVFKRASEIWIESHEGAYETYVAVHGPRRELISHGPVPEPQGINAMIDTGDYDTKGYMPTLERLNELCAIGDKDWTIPKDRRHGMKLPYRLDLGTSTATLNTQVRKWSVPLAGETPPNAEPLAVNPRYARDVVRMTGVTEFDRNQTTPRVLRFNGPNLSAMMTPLRLPPAP